MIFTSVQSKAASPDREKTLYLVGYAHLDSQWRWDYATTIDRYIRSTLDDNFRLLETYPEYTFNFTGASRYAMMKEYYPEKFEQVKKYIADGRWHVSGSSVDECDVLIPSPESVLRHVLYGNQYFRREFDVESRDFMLPDCFGFPSYLPSLWSHAGLLGFSTQKLTWGSAMGVPFNVGIWEGPDGKSVIAALNAMNYGGSVPERLDLDQTWANRIFTNGLNSGLFADYRYYGVGDQGGAPREEDVRNAVESLNNDDRKFNITMAASDQLYRDITPEQRARLPRYQGELMLTEHSSGTMTSEAYMKRWNRKNEQLADAAERAAVIADWLGTADYPAEQLHRSWWRMLVSQMHDILPGTALPKAYEYAWNDEILASNGFASVLTHSIGALARDMDTRVKGLPVLVYNPLSIDREDAVTARVRFEGENPKAVRVYNDRGREVPSQILDNGPGGVKVLFLAAVPSLGTSVFDVRPAGRPCTMNTHLRIEDRTLDNDYYRVTVNENGDIASVYDKKAKRELLSEPARLEFHRGTPSKWPAWNMDWQDRAFGPTGYVDGPAEIRVVENGPVRVALEVKRQARNSIFTQQIGLTAGDGGKRVEVRNDVDWQSSACVLKACFPLTVSNQVATYTQGLGTIQRSNNNPRQYEMLSHEWFDLTDSSADYGVSVLEDCKFGSDKPADDVVRLTLLYTPGADHGSYHDQLTQDWGRHEFVYALYGHEGPWQSALPEYQGRRLNQPLRAFQVSRHRGSLGRAFSMLQLNTRQVDVRALKQSEAGDTIIVRLQELLGKPADSVELSLGKGIVSAYEVDGQERKIGEADLVDGKLRLSMSKNAIRSFALKPAAAAEKQDKPSSQTLALDYNVSAFSTDGQSVEGAFGADRYSMPAEMAPRQLRVNGVNFALALTPNGSDRKDAVACQGQTIRLPRGRYNRLYILAAADEDTKAEIRIGGQSRPFAVQAWTGFIGQYDNRLWDRPFNEVDYQCRGRLTGIRKGFIKRDEVAWFCTHRHTAAGENEAYQFSYIFNYGFDLEAGADTLTLPDNPAIKVFAVSVAEDRNRAVPVDDLYDNFDNRKEIELRRPERDTAGVAAVGTVTMERADSYENLKLRQPSADDFADQGSSNGVDFSYICDGLSVAPTRGGFREMLPGLNDGLVADDSDDPERSTFFDLGRGTFYADLKKTAEVAEVNTFSWHRADRAPQRFTLWGAGPDASPDEKAGWTLVARVDTQPLGSGGVHVSSVVLPAGARYRYLLWETDLDDQGTFFNEIDVKTK